MKKLIENIIVNPSNPLRAVKLLIVLLGVIGVILSCAPAVDGGGGGGAVSPDFSASDVSVTLGEEENQGSARIEAAVDADSNPTLVISRLTNASATAGVSGSIAIIERVGYFTVDMTNIGFTSPAVLHSTNSNIESAFTVTNLSTGEEVVITYDVRIEFTGADVADVVTADLLENSLIAMLGSQEGTITATDTGLNIDFFNLPGAGTEGTLTVATTFPPGYAIFPAYTFMGPDGTSPVTETAESFTIAEVDRTTGVAVQPANSKTYTVTINYLEPISPLVSGDIVALFNGKMGTVRIEAAANPNSLPTVVITGFTSANDDTLGGTVTITPGTDFTVNSGSTPHIITFDDPGVFHSTNSNLSETFMVTANSETTTYNIRIEFTGAPVADVVTADLLENSLIAMLGSQGGTITATDTGLTIDFFNLPGAGTQGTLTVNTDSFPAGYDISPAYTFLDPDGTNATSVTGDLLIIAEVDSGAVVNNNSKTYTVMINYSEESSPLVSGDIEALFNGKMGTVSLEDATENSNPTVVITGFTSAGNIALMGMITITNAQAGVFTVDTASTSFNGPSVYHSTDRNIESAFTVTSTATGIETTYDIRIEFSSAPVADVVTADLLRSLIPMLGSQEGTIKAATDTNLTIQFFNPPGTGTEGTLRVNTDSFPVGYAITTAYTFTDPAGTGEVLGETGSFTIAEVDNGAVVNGNFETYTVTIDYLEPISPLVSGDIVALFNGKTGTVRIEAAANPNSLPTVVITGLTSANDATLGGTVTITPGTDFTVNSGSTPHDITFNGPSVYHSINSNLPDTFTVTPTAANSVTADYKIRIEFTGAPVATLVTADLLGYLMPMLGRQDGTITAVSSTGLTIEFINPVGATTSGTLTFDAGKLPVGYEIFPAYTFTDPAGANEVTGDAGSFTIAEVDSGAVVNNNSENYTVTINYSASIPPLVPRDIIASFNGKEGTVSIEDAADDNSNPTVVITGLTSANDANLLGAVDITARPGLTVDSNIVPFNGPSVYHSINSNLSDDFTITNSITGDTTTFNIRIEFTGTPVATLVTEALLRDSLIPMLGTERGTITDVTFTGQTIEGLTIKFINPVGAGTEGTLRVDATTFPERYDIFPAYTFTDPDGIAATSVTDALFTIAEVDGSGDAVMPANSEKYTVSIVYRPVPLVSSDIIASFNGGGTGVVSIEAAATPNSNPTVVITGFTSANDVNLPVTVDITARPGLTVDSNSISFNGPSVYHSTNINRPNAFTVTDSVTSDATTYNIRIEFTGTPVATLVTEALLRDSFTTVTLGSQDRTATLTLSGTTIEIAFLNPAGGGAAGMLAAPVPIGFPVRYSFSAYSHSFSDPSGTGATTQTVSTLTISEVDANGDPVPTNSQDYTVRIAYKAPILEAMDITAMFGSAEGTVQITGTNIAITGLKNYDDSLVDSNGDDLKFSIAIADTTNPVEFTITTPLTTTSLTNGSGVLAGTSETTDINLGTLTITTLDVGLVINYPVSVSFATPLQLQVSGDIVLPPGDNNITISEGDPTASITANPCSEVLPTFVEATGYAVGAIDTSLPYVLDRTTSTDTKDVTVEVFDGSDVAGTFNFDYIVSCEVGDLVGDGSATPYEISSASQLDLVSHLVDTDATYRAANYQVTAAIDLGVAGAPWAESSGGQGFDPIGGEYDGVFDCQGYIISNLYINRGGATNVGLIATLGSSSPALQPEVTNCALEGIKITGRVNVGGMVGNLNWGSISNSYTTGLVNTETLTSVSVSNIGGLVGIINSRDGLVYSSYSTATVKSRSSSYNSAANIGGLVGSNNGGKITNSYATGAVTGNNYNGGGLVGSSALGSIIASYATGAVSGSSRLGALVGIMRSSIENSYASGTVTGSGTKIGGLVGTNNGGTLTNSSEKTLAELQAPTTSGATSADLYYNWDGRDIWHFGTSSQLPALRDTPGGTGVQRN